MARLTSAWKPKKTTKVNASKHTLICNAILEKYIYHDKISLKIIFTHG
jgi:hypothetical protein